MSQAPHIPAWKRLGLKLKYAKEDAPESAVAKVTSDGSESVKINGKHENGHLNGSLPPTSNGSGPHTNGHKDGPPPAKKQKRVSFTPDTKARDGDGDGASTARSATPSELAKSSSSSTITGSNLNTEAPATATTTTPKAKPSKKSKAAPTPPSKHKSQNMLDYLHQYYNNHSSWKFQKNREVWILKHAFSTEDIPTKDYGLALAQYVYGLKSEGARKRLTEEAEEKVAALASTDETDEKEKSTRESPPAEQLKRLREMLASFPGNPTTAAGGDDDDESTQHDAMLAAISRPLLIFTALHPDGDLKSVQTPPSRSAADSPLSKPQAASTKKRKNRTSVVEYSSSSDSESSSDSDSDSDSDGSSKGPAEDDETSSSGSSSESE